MSIVREDLYKAIRSSLRPLKDDICSNDATNFHFFARARKDKISIIVKQLGEQTMEFYLPRKKIKEYAIQSHFY